MNIDENQTRELRIEVDGNVVFQIQNARVFTWKTMLITAIFELLASLTILCVCYDSESVHARFWILAYSGRHVIQLPYSYYFWVEDNRSPHIAKVISRLNFWQLW